MEFSIKSYGTTLPSPSTLLRNLIEQINIHKLPELRIGPQPNPLYQYIVSENFFTPFVPKKNIEYIFELYISPRNGYHCYFIILSKF